MKFILFVSLVVLLSSCQKDGEDVAGFRYMSIEDTHGFVLGKYSSGTDTINKLFRINSTDKLEEVVYLSDNKTEVFTNRVPVVMYDLGKSSFMVVYRVGNKNLYESYIVRRFDGYMKKLPQVVLPEQSGRIDYSINALRADNHSCYYFTAKNENHKLDLSDPDKPAITALLTGESLGASFVADYAGNILTTDKLYPVTGNAVALQYKNPAYTYPVNSWKNCMYYITKTADSIQFVKLDVTAENNPEMKLYPSVKLNEAESVFINSHAFADRNASVVILSKAIVQIEGNSATSVDLLSLNLKEIISSTSSGTYYFIYGMNKEEDEGVADKKVLLRVDPSALKPVYTQLVARDYVEIRYFSASYAGNLVFSGIRLKDNKKIFGYIPLNGSNTIVDDDQGINEIQVLSH